MSNKIQGIVSGLSIEAYHQDSSISSTGLRELKKSPAHYKAYIDSARQPTQAMAFGTGFHALVGEPHLFASKYVKAPEGLDKRTKEGKETYALFLEKNQGKEILSHEDYDRMDGMLSALIHNKTALHLLTNGQAEQSIFWTDKETGVMCKCRPDFLRSDGIVVDLKTSEDATAQGFQKSISNYDYHIQSAFYLEGVSQIIDEPLSDFVHLVVEKKRPHGIGIFTLDDMSLEIAQKEIRNLLRTYAECTATGKFPGYLDQVTSVSLPAWMLSAKG